MMLNAQKTISPSSKAANFKRHFGRFIAKRSRVVCASKRNREKRTVRSHKDVFIYMFAQAMFFQHLFIIKKAAAGETENRGSHPGNANPL